MRTERHTRPVYFTPAEEDILAMFATGAQSSKQVADKLGVSVNTVRTQRQNVITKAGTFERAVAIWAARTAEQLLLQAHPEWK